MMSAPLWRLEKNVDEEHATHALTNEMLRKQLDAGLDAILEERVDAFFASLGAGALE